jgi:DNA-binding transcriptional MerR regulator
VSLRRGPRRKGLRPPSGEVPQKLFYKIGEVSRITGLAPYVLRYWETEFPQIRPRKGRGGQRVYRPEDVAAVLEIRRMLHAEGYTIEGARRKLGRTRPAAPVKTPAGPGEGASGPRETRREAVAKAREGLRDLLNLMENTDSRRTGSRDDSGRGAVR